MIYLNEIRNFIINYVSYIKSGIQCLEILLNMMIIHIFKGIIIVDLVSIEKTIRHLTVGCATHSIMLTYMIYQNMSPDNCGRWVVVRTNWGFKTYSTDCYKIIIMCLIIPA